MSVTKITSFAQNFHRLNYYDRSASSVSQDVMKALVYIPLRPLPKTQKQIIQEKRKVVSYIILACNLSRSSGFLLMDPFLLGKVDGCIAGLVPVRGRSGQPAAINSSMVSASAAARA